MTQAFSLEPSQRNTGIDRSGAAIVADDHPIFRDGMALILSELFPPLRTRLASSFDEVLALAGEEQRLELMVLDLKFPGMDLARIPDLRAVAPGASVLIVSMCDDQGSVRRILRSGVDGFISKAADPQSMREGLAAVRAGEFVNIGGGLGIGPVSSLMARYPALTQRQIDVLLLLAQGRSNKDIARDLNISPFTVRLHVSATLRTLGVESRSAAAAIAAKFDL
nr:response regulator transcription factor [uncultured Sphingomonas sp.]